MFKNPDYLNFKFETNFLLQAISVSVLEEIIYRMYLYSILIKSYKGHSINKRIAYMFLIIPFVLIHYPGQAIEFGIVNIIPNAIQKTIIALPIAYAMINRDLITAIAIHFFVNFFTFVLF